MDDGNDTSMEGHRHRTHDPSAGRSRRDPKTGRYAWNTHGRQTETHAARAAGPARAAETPAVRPLAVAANRHRTGPLRPDRHQFRRHESGEPIGSPGLLDRTRALAQRTQRDGHTPTPPGDGPKHPDPHRPGGRPERGHRNGRHAPADIPDGTQPEDSSSTAASVQTPEPRDIDPEPQQAWTQGPSLPDRETARNPPAAQPPIQAETQPEAQTDFSRIPSNAHVSVDANGTRISWRITTTLFRAYHAQRHPNPAYPRIRDDIAPSVMTASCRTFDRGSQPPARFGRIRIPADPSARPLPTSDSAFYWFRIVTGYDIKRENIDVAVGSYPAMRTIMALPMIQRDLRPASTVIDIDPLGIFQAFAGGRNVEIVAGNRRTISEIEFQFQESFRPAAVASARLCNAVGWKR